MITYYLVKQATHLVHKPGRDWSNKWIQPKDKRQTTDFHLPILLSKVRNQIIPWHDIWHLSPNKRQPMEINKQTQTTKLTHNNLFGLAILGHLYKWASLHTHNNEPRSQLFQSKPFGFVGGPTRNKLQACRPKVLLGFWRIQLVTDNDDQYINFKQMGTTMECLGLCSSLGMALGSTPCIGVHVSLRIYRPF